MRREHSICSIAVVLLLTVSGCEKPARTTAGQDTSKSGPSRNGTGMPGEDCIPSETGGNLTCGNLLPANWETLKDDALKPVAEKLILLMKSYSRQAFTTVVRQASMGCKTNPGKPDRTLDVLLRAPFAMDSFPRVGTGGRELVISLFDVKRDERCAEERYDVLKNRGQSRESIEFSTVTSTAATAPGGTTKTIGKWNSWALSWKTSGTNKKYELVWLKTGQWKQCGHVHPATVGDVAFISCQSANTLARIAYRSKARDSSFQSLLVKFMQRDSTLMAQTDGDPFSDAAWGRCGSLGCCASEGT